MIAKVTVLVVFSKFGIFQLQKPFPDYWACDAVAYSYEKTLQDKFDSSAFVKCVQTPAPGESLAPRKRPGR